MTIDYMPLLILYLTITSSLNAFQLREIHNLRVDMEAMKEDG